MSWVAIGGLWIALTALGGWIVDDVVSGYRDAEARLANQAQVYARMVASHDRFEIEMADQIIKSLLVHMDDNLFNGEPDEARRAAFERLLAEHRSRLPGIASFSVVGANGIRRFGVAGKTSRICISAAISRPCRPARRKLSSARRSRAWPPASPASTSPVHTGGRMVPLADWW